jgi:hypothetical protein
MKKFQVKENSPQQIMVILKNIIKRLQKDDTKQLIKQTLVWCIIRKHQGCYENTKVYHLQAMCC